MQHIKGTRLHRVEGLRPHRVGGLRPHRVEGTRLHRVEGTILHRVEDTILHRLEDKRLHRAIKDNRLYRASYLFCSSTSSLRTIMATTAFFNSSVKHSSISSCTMYIKFKTSCQLQYQCHEGNVFTVWHTLLLNDLIYVDPVSCCPETRTSPQSLTNYHHRKQTIHYLFSLFTTFKFKIFEMKPTQIMWSAYSIYKD